MTGTAGCLVPIMLRVHVTGLFTILGWCYSAFPVLSSLADHAAVTSVGDVDTLVNSASSSHAVPKSSVHYFIAIPSRDTMPGGNKSPLVIHSKTD